MHQADVVLDVRGLTKHFPVSHGGPFGLGERRVLHAVDNVSFSLRRGEVLALVGESGSGKSTIARLLARLYAPTAGQAILHGEDIFALRGRRAVLRYRSQVQMVFQDPFGSLNPTKSVGHHVERALSLHRRSSAAGMRAEILDLLRTVGLTPAEEIAGKLPHQLSGGQRQRVSFARALAVRPDVLVADEPISMLDVSIRMGILNLMDDLRRTRGLSFLYITHDIASARYLADRTMVLYAGQVMELAPTEQLVREPLHPYTQLLLSAVPNPQQPLKERTVANRGEAGPAISPRSACRFASRCPQVMEECRRVTPSLREVRPGHWVRCHLYADVVTPSAVGR
jgi:peptide/nickel transport system ATP-binding protein